MSSTRKALLSVIAVVAVAALALVGLRLMADSAAGDYPEAVRANLERYEGIYRADRELAAARAEAQRTEARIPAKAGKVEKAARIGPPMGRFYAANTRILRREIAETPELKKVPLAAALSPKWKAMRAKERRLDASYAEGLRLSVEAEEFFPAFGPAYDRFSRIIIFAPLAAQTAKAMSDLRDLSTETFGGNAAQDTRKDIAERVRNDKAFRGAIATTPMPESYAKRKQAVLDVIDRRIEAGAKLDLAIREQDQAAWDRWKPVFVKNDEAKYVGDYLTLCSELSRLHDRFSDVAERVQQQADAL